jgi:hypothetical protein
MTEGEHEKEGANRPPSFYAALLPNFVFYGCRETTTSPDRELVVPLQVTAVELA